MTSRELESALQLHQAGRFQEAEHAYRNVLSLQPNDPQALYYLGILAQQTGRTQASIDLMRQVISLRSHYAEAHYNLGIGLKKIGEITQAIAAYRQAIALKPEYAQAYNNLGSALSEMGQYKPAICAYENAIAHDPQLAEAYNNLGNALSNDQQFEQAAAAYSQAIALQPNQIETHLNLGTAHYLQGHLDAAIAAYRQGVLLRPDFAKGHILLGNALRDQGQIQEAIVAYQAGIALAPEDAAAHSNLLYTLLFDPAYGPRQLAEAHRQWDEQHALPLRTSHRPHTNNPDRNRPLRIGYVSPDFRDHVAGQAILPLLRAHDRQQFQTVCYSSTKVSDAATAHLQESANLWRNIVGISDAQAAEQIRADQIDILVDLSLHAAQNRLLIFARKPAPVQVTYLGYCGTTGLSAMDYRLSDWFLDPGQIDLTHYSEKTVRLDSSFWCYHPDPLAPDVAISPAKTNGFITFGCLNHFGKVSQQTVSRWIEILLRVPNSKLLLHAKPGRYRQTTVDRFVAAGVAADRIEFVGTQPYLQYLSTYHRMDIALDPYPYAGGITSCDCLWMGVPLITLAGTQSPVSRAGCSILANIGHEEWIARNEADYVSIAIDLAGELPRLESFRQNLRSHMQHSPLLNMKQFVCNFEQALRNMWQDWCDSNPQP